MGKETKQAICHEWFKQAEYDIKSAEIMFEKKRYIHTVFLCHLAVEKALKGLYVQRLEGMPPKTHNLIFLAEKIGLNLPETLHDFIFTLTGVSIQTRYPDELHAIKKSYNKSMARTLLVKSKETLKWLKAMS